MMLPRGSSLVYNVDMTPVPVVLTVWGIRQIKSHEL